ncbi:MAG: lytic transglycosylase domain-containing protein, partial [Chromatiaceae bacterium]|nr:lytic transglycosylase domain-containing protein [Candidatus Thioaporhodococcus sediminis]
MMTRWQPLIDRYATQYGVPPTLIAKMIERESGGNPRAISPAGAQGLMQLMPGTAREVGVTDPFDPEQAIRGGVSYYAKQRDKFGPKIALAAYHSGPGTVEQIGGDVSKLGPQGRAYYAALEPYADGPAPPQAAEQRSAPMQPIPIPPPVEEEKPGLFGQLAGHPLFNMGLGILAANQGNYGKFAPAFGQGALAGMANYQAQQRTALEQRRLQEMQRLARYKLQNEAQAVAAVEEFIQKLPPEQQALARANPDEFSKMMMKRQ